MGPSLKAFAGVSGLAFLVLFSYGLARSPIDSLFMEAHGSGGLPWAWALVAVASVLTVFVYNRASHGRSLLTAFSASAGIFAVLLGLVLLLVSAEVENAWYAVYVWKDVHVVVLLEIIWTLANSTFKTGSARRAYGLFCAAGSVGGMAGHFAAGQVSVAFGAGTALWFALGPLTVLALAVEAFRRVRPGASPAPEPRSRATSGYSGGIRILRGSRYLGWLLILILLTQLSITLIEFHFYDVMKSVHPDADERTVAFSRVYMMIDGTSLVLQLTTSWILKALGIYGTMLAIPSILSVTVLASLVDPRAAVITAARVASKAFDYSLFRAAKEMLYIPLSYDEKTRGKAMIDMLTYRVAKGGAAIGLGLLVANGFGGPAVLYLVLGLIAGWLAVTVVIVRRYLELPAVSRERG
ncbi:MAG: hypothetical protein DRJ42_22760 [Deltaproteobacteria bacterium]|nr:MAG: hypothetical protein DRJ42_22760 [Deltaproteobacteria bacterium]